MNRTEAGRLLGEKLRGYAGRNDVIVLALPRGGVPVGYEIAKAIGAELDVFFVRKIGVPGFPELAMGAMASGGMPALNVQMVEEFGLSKEQVEAAILAGQREMARQEAAYRGRRPPLELKGKTVILVDDGIATGYTIRAAAEAARRMGAARVVVATGAAPVSTCERLQSEVDEVVSLITAQDFRAVGNYFEDFSQVSDEEVKRLLGKDTKAGVIQSTEPSFGD
ncbi:MAG TPA: phosphoribosyltransferase family protein [Terriglobales bacterium]|nr:phosphoribosyltransferase family protein [Terriglobales bacterium]